MHKSVHFGIVFSEPITGGELNKMKEGIDRYSERKPEDKDWYVSVRICQAVLCSLFVLALFISCKTNARDKIKEGYDYLTGFSLTKEDVFGAADALKNFAGFSRNA